MKKLRILSATALLALLISGCGGRSLPLFGRGGASIVEKASVAVPVMSPAIQKLMYEDEVIGFDGSHFYIEVDAPGDWYHQWSDIVHTVLGVDSCFSEVPEAEKEGVFWVGVSQIPQNVHPDKFSGKILIPHDCEEAKAWAAKVTTILDQGKAEAWKDWAGWIAERLKNHPIYDFREGGES